MRVGLQITKNIDKHKKLVSLFDFSLLKDVSFIHIKDYKSLEKNFKNLNVLVCYGITPELFRCRSDKLKWIHIGASGVDGNLFPEILKSKVIITNAKGINSKPVAEFIMSQILYFSKRDLSLLSLPEIVISAPNAPPLIIVLSVQKAIRLNAVPLVI